MYSPYWFHGFLPDAWWDRPRELFFHEQNLLPLLASEIRVVDMPLGKKNDVLVFGGCCHITSVDNTTIHCPLSGVYSRILVNLFNPSGAVKYTQGFNVVTPSPDDMVPVDNLFSTNQHEADRPAIWPVPITVFKGGSLSMRVQDLSNAPRNVRFTLWCVPMFDLKDRLPRAA